MKKKIFLIGCLVFLVPFTSYSWFSIQAGYRSDFQPEFFVGEPEIVSNHYVLPYNKKEKNGASVLRLGSIGKASIDADSVNIDILLNALSKEVIDPVSSLDRQIAANLRIRNLLEEYLALKKRTSVALKDLSIPYLETNKKRSGDIREKMGNFQILKNLEKEIKTISTYSVGYLATNDNQIDKEDTVLETVGQFKNKGTLVTDLKQADNKLNESDKYRNLPQGSLSNSSIDELPWIFRLILGIVRYVYSNKSEILLWCVVIATSSLILTMVVKK